MALESPEHKREHQASVVEETMLGTALTAFGLRGVPKVVERINACGAASDADTKLAHFKALMLDCLTDTPGALGSQVALQCFARCLDDASSVSAQPCLVFPFKPGGKWRTKTARGCFKQHCKWLSNLDCCRVVVCMRI